MRGFRVAIRTYLDVAHHAIEPFSLWVNELAVVTPGALFEHLFSALWLYLFQLQPHYPLVFIQRQYLLQYLIGDVIFETLRALAGDLDLPLADLRLHALSKALGAEGMLASLQVDRAVGDSFVAHETRQLYMPLQCMHSQVTPTLHTQEVSLQGALMALFGETAWGKEGLIVSVGCTTAGEEGH